jgi:single-strand DNA-binding protein
MSDMNNVCVTGRLTRDSITKTLPSGTQLVEFSIANNMGWGDNARVAFIDVKFWGKGAVAISKFLIKGKRIGITGQICMDSWVDKTSGGNRTRLYINTFDVQMLDKLELEHESSSTYNEIKVEEIPF